MSPKSKKIISGLILVCFLSFLFVFILEIEPAHGLFSTKLKELIYFFVAKAISLVLNIVRYVLSLAFWLAAMFFKLTLGVGEFQDAAVVKMGWKITRNIANLFLALMLLIVALATIFKLENFGYKKTLWRLIAVALLINFSLSISGVVIDFSQIATAYFYNKMVDEQSGGAAEGIADTLGIQKLNKIDPKAKAEELEEEEDEDKEEGLTVRLFKLIFSLILNIVVLAISSIVFFLAGIIMLIRTIIIYILLILAPLAWLLAIFPNTQQYFQKWWSKLIHWSFFAPIFMFFVYLATTVGSMKGFENLVSDQMEKVVEEEGWNNVLTGMAWFTPRLITQFSVIIGFLIGGLIVAHKAGLEGGQRITQWAGAKASTIGRGIGRYGYAGMRGRAGRAMERMGRAKPLAQTRIGRGLQMAGRRQQALAAQKKTEAAETLPFRASYKQALSTMSDDHIYEEATTQRGTKQLFAAQELAKRPSFVRTASVDQIRHLRQSLDRFGQKETLDELSEKRPDAISRQTPEGRKEFQQVAEKIVHEGTTDKLPAVALQDSQLVAALSSLGAKMDKVAEVSPAHRTNLEKTLGQMVADNGQVTPQAQVIGGPPLDAEKIHHAYAALSGDLGRMSDQQRQSFGRSAGVEALKNITIHNQPEHIKQVAEQIPANQIVKAIQAMKDDRAAEMIIEHIERTPNARAHQRVRSDPYFQGRGRP